MACKKEINSKNRKKVQEKVTSLLLSMLAKRGRTGNYQISSL